MTLQDAKNRFSELVRRVLSDGPQMVTRGRAGEGQDAVVVLSMTEYQRLLGRMGSLLAFLQRSPLADVDLDIDRPRAQVARSSSEGDVPRALSARHVHRLRCRQARTISAAGKWLGAQRLDDLAIGALTFGELRYGVERLPAGRKRTDIITWLETQLPQRFAGWPAVGDRTDSRADVRDAQ